jgi:hypothetical protein
VIRSAWCRRRSHYNRHAAGFVTLTVHDSNVVFRLNQSWLFRRQVSGESPRMCVGVCVIRAILAEDVMSRQLAGKMKNSVALPKNTPTAATFQSRATFHGAVERSNRHEFREAEPKKWVCPRAGLLRSFRH